MSEPILYLASASPRRHEILKQMDIAHHVLHVPAPDGEDEPELPGESPQNYVIRTAREKAIRAAQWLMDASAHEIAAHVTESYPDRAVEFSMHDKTGSSCPPCYILSADTTVILDDRVLGKPVNEDDAADTLRALSGRTHKVHTAIALYHDGRLFHAVSVSEVRFKELSDTEIQSYCRSGEHAGKAGSYAIQGRAAAFVSHLSGSFTGVMGLPAYETSSLLAQHGFFV